jgi:hypothetical protein
MAKRSNRGSDKGETKELEAAVNECLSQIKLTNERMILRQREIDQLKAETRALLNRIRQFRAA